MKMHLARIIRAWLTPAVCALFAASACDKQQPPAPAVTKTTATPSNQDDLGAMRAMLSEKSNTKDSGAPGPATTQLSQGRQSRDAIIFTPPPEWIPEPPTSRMRKAQYKLPKATGDPSDAQLVVFFFGQGQGGSIEQNLTRWKGMFSTPDGSPVPQDEISQTSRKVDGMNVTVLDISGRYVDPMAGGQSKSPPTEDSRMLAAIVETPQGPWFFKAVGPKATMKAHADNFNKFVGSVKKAQ
jgi:hypothetical protein